MAFPFLARPFLGGRVWKKTGRLHYHTYPRTNVEPSREQHRQQADTFGLLLTATTTQATKAS